MILLLRETRLNCCLITLVLVLMLGMPHTGLAATDDDALIAMGLCEDMDQNINTVADFTETKCIPALDDRGNNFIFISSNPVFTVESSEEAWALVVIAAFGHEFNNKSNYEVRNIYLSDVNMAKTLNYFVLSGELAKQLQSQVYNGQIEPEAAWATIVSSMQPYKGPPRKP